MSFDDVRAELVRSRGFIRGAETQLTKSLAALDALEEEMILRGGGGGVVAVPATAPVAGVAVALRVERQPTGAVDNAAFTTQPRVEVIDGYGDRVTGSSASITAAKATGSGTLSGTTSVNAASGLATFTNLVITGTGNHSLTFSSTGLAPVTSGVFNVEAASDPDIDAILQVDWSGRTVGDYGWVGGPTWNATEVLDGSLLSGAAGMNHTIISPPAGFPAGITRCYRNVATTDTDGFAFLRAENTLGVLASGSTRYYRWYWRLECAASMVTGSGENGDHPVHDGNTLAVSASNWLVTMGWPTTTTCQPGFFGNGTVGTFQCDTNLDRNKVYRFELAITRSGSNYTVAFNIFDETVSTTVAILTAADFVNNNDSGLLSARTFTFADVNRTQSFTFGLNDFDTEIWYGDAPMNYASWGGLAIADDSGAIGAYGSVTGEA